MLSQLLSDIALDIILLTVINAVCVQDLLTVQHRNIDLNVT